MSKNCINCGKQIDDIAVFCQFCGQTQPKDSQTPDIPIQAAPVYEPPVQQETPRETFKSESEVKYVSQKKKKKSKAPLIIILVVLLLAILGIGGFFGWKYWWVPRHTQQTDYSVAELTLDNATAEQIEDLANYTALSELTIKNSSIDSAALSKVLMGNSTIKTLNLTNDGISDISFVKSLKVLTTLCLDDSSSIKWADVVDLEENTSVNISFSTEWSRALADEVNKYLASLPNAENCTAYVCDMDSNGIPEVFIGKGVGWNYPSFIASYSNGKAVIFPYNNMLEMSGTGVKSAHFTVHSGSEDGFIQSEIYDGTGYYCTGIWSIGEEGFVLEATATNGITDEMNNPYFQSAKNTVLHIGGEDAVTADEEETVPAEDTDETAAETVTDDAAADGETAETGLDGYDVTPLRKGALEAIFPDSANYTPVLYEEVSRKDDAVGYLSKYLFEEIKIVVDEDAKATAVASSLSLIDVISYYAPDGVINGDGKADAAESIIKEFRLYYVPDENSTDAIVGEASFLGAVEVYDRKDYDKTGDTHIEYLFGDKAGDGTYRDVAYFVNVEDNSIVKAGRETEYRMVWKDGKAVDLEKAQQFFENLGVSGTVDYTVDGYYYVFYIKGEQSGTIYADWNLSKAWFEDDAGNTTDVYPTDEAGILPQ